MRRTGAVRAAGGSGEGSAAVRRDGGERGSKGTAVQLRGDAWTAVRAARGEGDVMDTLESLRAELADARARLAEVERHMERPWGDRPDEWTDAISVAFPTRSGRHDLFARAMAMVGNRNAKAALVSLVNWLLVRLAEAERRETEARADFVAERDRRREIALRLHGEADALRTRAEAAEGLLRSIREDCRLCHCNEIDAHLSAKGGG
jgi:hypothetical protein